MSKCLTPAGNGWFMMFVCLLMEQGACGSIWDAALPMARDVVNPKQAIQDRLWKMNELLSMLDRMDSASVVVFVKSDASGMDNGTGWKNAYRSVQRAIDAAAAKNGGWVWVAQGQYTERIWLKSGVILMGGFRGDEIVAADRNPAYYRTILSGNGKDPVVFMQHKTVIDGFTIMNGGKGKYNGGGGVLTGDWLAVIRNNIFRDNHVEWSGGGVFVYGGTDVNAPQMDSTGYSPVLYGNVFFRNSAKCGDGICLRHTTAMVAQNTVANHPRRGIEIVTERGDEPTVVNSIAYNNGIDVYNQYDDQGVVHGMAFVPYNCFTRSHYGAEGEGVLYADPMFADSANGDFSLLGSSPCVDRGLPGGPKDLDSTVADLGAYFFRGHQDTNGMQFELQSSPQNGMRIQVDGRLYFTPCTFSFKPNSHHELRPALVQKGDPDSRFRFQSWGHAGTWVQDLDVVRSGIRWEAQYGMQHYLKVELDGPGSMPLGEGWYDQGNRVSLFADSLVGLGAGERLFFSGWSGSGSGSVTSEENSIVVMINGPITEKAKWKRQYRLQVRIDSAGTNGTSVTVSPNRQWHDADASVLLEAKSKNPEIRFLKWEGDTTGQQNPIRIHMSRPWTLVAAFEKKSVNPPGPFSLLLPASDSILPIGDGKSQRFVWQGAADPDDADSVAYDFYLNVSADLETNPIFHADTGKDTSLWLSNLQIGSGAYYWGVKARDVQGYVTWCRSSYKIDIRTGVEDCSFLPVESGLNQNYPNPFNRQTTLSFQLADPEKITVRIADASGRILRLLIDAEMEKGKHRLVWDGKDADGKDLPSGVYLIRLDTPNRAFFRKMIFLK